MTAPLETGTFGVGAAVYPLTSDPAHALLQDADPALFYGLAFFESVIRTHIGARWDVAVAAAGLPELVGKIVAQTTSYDPTASFHTGLYQTPLLALYRMKSKYRDRTVSRRQRDCRWGFDWILPPLTPGQLYQLHPFLTAVESTLMDRTEQGFDPSFLSGAVVWNVAGVVGISVAESEQTNLQLRGPANTPQMNTPFPTLHVEFDVEEMTAAVEGAFPPLAGIDTTVSVGNDAPLSLDPQAPPRAASIETSDFQVNTP